MLVPQVKQYVVMLKDLTNGSFPRFRRNVSVKTEFIETITEI